MVVESRANSLIDYGLANPSRISCNHGSTNFVMKKVIVEHTGAVLSVSTVGDNIVCCSSADKTIRVWRREGPEMGWEYEHAIVLTET
eukprot:c15607_g2_i1 orf=65-325(+)